MKTRIYFLLDRSGSMKTIYDDTVKGFNTYLEELQKSENALNLIFSRIQFDSYEIFTEFSDVPIRSVPGLDKDNFKPRGMTPLIEAATKTIDAASNKEWDGKTIFVIMTDGQENSSKAKYTNKHLADLIAEKTKEGWEFVFLGAGIDAYEQANALGIKDMNTVSYDSSDRGATLNNYKSVARNTQLYASGQSDNMSFSSAQKAEAGDKFAPNTKEKDLPGDQLQVKL